MLAVACTSKNDVVRPQVKPLIEAVYASGVIVAEQEYQVTSQVDGYLAEVLAEEGDSIQKGQPLFLIESTQQNARLQIAKEQFELAQLNYKARSPVLQELEAASASAYSKFQFDSVNYARYANLLKQRATTQLEFDRAKLALDNSRNDFLLQQSRLEKTRNQLRLEYENARRQLDIAREETGRYEVRSEINGKLLVIQKEKNELVRRGEAIAVAGDAGNFYLRLTVDELDVRKVQQGQTVLVKLEAYGDKVFEGVITKVYPQVDARQQSLRVDARLRDELDYWLSGLSVEANIVIQKKESALVIPRSLLLEGDSVWVRASDADLKMKITKGIETLEEVEIISGLTRDSELIR